MGAVRSLCLMMETDIAFEVYFKKELQDAGQCLK
jgi:hypothetical protein